MLCIITENGYKFECSGRVIPFTGFNLALLTGEEFVELKNTEVDMVSHMMVKSAVARIEEKLDVVALCVDKVTRTDVSEEGIVKIVEAWYEGLLIKYADPDHPLSKQLSARTVKDLKQFLKNTFLNTGSLATAGIAIAIFIAGFSALVYGMVKLAQ